MKLIIPVSQWVDDVCPDGTGNACYKVTLTVDLAKAHGGGRDTQRAQTLEDAAFFLLTDKPNRQFSIPIFVRRGPEESYWLGRTPDPTTNLLRDVTVSFDTLRGSTSRPLFPILELLPDPTQYERQTRACNLVNGTSQFIDDCFLTAGGQQIAFIDGTSLMGTIEMFLPKNLLFLFDDPANPEPVRPQSLAVRLEYWHWIPG